MSGWFDERFIKCFIRNILIWLLCAALGTAITYFFIDKSMVTNPNPKSIIGVSIGTIVYIISTIIGLMITADKRT